MITITKEQVEAAFVSQGKTKKASSSKTKKPGTRKSKSQTNEMFKKYNRN